MESDARKSTKRDGSCDDESAKLTGMSNDTNHGVENTSISTKLGPWRAMFADILQRRSRRLLSVGIPCALVAIGIITFVIVYKTIGNYIGQIN